MNSEHKFWENILDTSNPGWSTKITPGWLEDQKLSDLTVYSYIVDTSNGWTVVGGLTPDKFKEVWAHYKEVPKKAVNKFLDEIHSTLLAASDANAQPGSELAMNACVMAMMSICDTGTFELARQSQPSLKGHWISVLYRTKDGACLRRPAYTFGDGGAQPLDPAELYGAIQQIIDIDRNPRTNVGKQIQAAGGAKIHAGFGGGGN